MSIPFWVKNHCLKVHDLLKCTAVNSMVCLHVCSKLLFWTKITLVFCSRIRVYCTGKFIVHLSKTRPGKQWIVWHALRKSWQIYIQRETRVLLATWIISPDVEGFERTSLPKCSFWASHYNHVLIWTIPILGGQITSNP